MELISDLHSSVVLALAHTDWYRPNGVVEVRPDRHRWFSLSLGLISKLVDATHTCPNGGSSIKDYQITSDYLTEITSPYFEAV